VSVLHCFDHVLFKCHLPLARVGEPEFFEFVRHQVRRDDYRKGSPENPWPEVFSEFSRQITAADWQAIVERVEAFPTLGLDWWLKPLRSTPC
jgi:hypothetical protein